MLKYYLIDLETTGLSYITHEPTEISIIRASDKVQLFKKIKCERGHTASLDALRITGKTFADLKKGDSKQYVVEEANRFFNEDGLAPANRCIVGHNIISFDRKFLHALWESQDKEFPAHLFLDTLTLTKEFIKQTDISKLNLIKTATGKISKKLQDACDMVGAQKAKASHNARSDSISNYFLWKKLVEDHKIDYLPHIKSYPHYLKSKESEEGLDIDFNDLI